MYGRITSDIKLFFPNFNNLASKNIHTKNCILTPRGLKQRRGHSGRVSAFSSRGAAIIERNGLNFV